MTIRLDSKILFAAWACNNKKWHTYQLWDGPLRNFFKQVITFDPKEYQDKFGKKEMNAKFLEIVGKEKPDYIFFWFMLDEIDFETLAKIREISPKTVTLCYNGDDDYKFDNYTMHLFPFVDYFLSTQPDILEKYDKLGKKVFYSCGADIKEFKPSNVKKEIEVSFVGTPKNDRVDFMRHLLKNNISIRVYGAGWEKYPEFAKCHGGEINMHEFVDVINKSKINICLSKNYFGGTHILERFFEINACNSFCLTEYAKGYFPTFIEGKDIATFKDKEELVEKVKKYLKDDKSRENIAKKAYLKTIKNFSNDLLFSKALKFIESDKKNRFGKLPDKINKKIIYLGLEDLAKGKKYLEERLIGVDYVGFRNKGNYYLNYKEYIQITALEMTGKDICVCDSVLNSRLIGDFLSVCLYYAYDLSNKSYFYSNLDISQIVTKKEYLLDNLDKFVGLFNGKSASFINKKNTNFVSWPLVRRAGKTKVPLENMEHIVFPYFERDLLVLKNKNKIFRSTYPLRLAIYSLINKQVAKIILNNTIKRTKNNRLIKIASFINKF